ncbi:MAG: diphthine--ammonia ligase [Thermoplasmatota archaeon]
MRCAVLLSGGKDSVAAVELAQGCAWDVVVAIVMRPAEDDAWMYHVPNLDVTRGIAEAMGMPILEWPARTGQTEEVEDLKAALQAAKETYHIDAVLSGALASEYQKTRIDRVGHELGIKTFAPIWHKNPETYIRSLQHAGYDLRFSRVAADGLDETWAGAQFDEAKLAYLKAHKSRPHIAGEGGEFETLVLDAPHYRAPVCVTESHVDATASRATWIVDAHSLRLKND